MRATRWTFAAVLAAVSYAEQELTIEEDEFTVLPQVYEEEEILQMLLDNYSKYNARLDFEGGFQQTQPAIAIATTPVFSPLMETTTFSFPHFTWETNVNFIHYAGSWAVPVRYDLSDEDLEELLDSVNGVFFGGGATPLVDHDTGEQSFFYKTAKRIWEYMKRQKDEKDIDFPIFGICQGFELIHFLANEDHKATLSNVTIYGESRSMDLTIDDAKKDAELFDSFPDELLVQMQTEKILLHSHDWVIKTDTYEERQPLQDFFEILATDNHRGEEFVVAVEGKHYPVSGVMFHPETQNRHIVGTADGSLTGKVNDQRTEAMNFYFSEHVRRQGAKNMDTHRFANPEFGLRMEWLNTNLGLTRGGIDSYLPALGF